VAAINPLLYCASHPTAWVAACRTLSPFFILFIFIFINLPRTAQARGPFCNRSLLRQLRIAGCFEGRGCAVLTISPPLRFAPVQSFLKDKVEEKVEGEVVVGWGCRCPEALRREEEGSSDAPRITVGEPS